MREYVYFSKNLHEKTRTIKPILSRKRFVDPLSEIEWIPLSTEEFNRLEDADYRDPNLFQIVADDIWYDHVWMIKAPLQLHGYRHLFYEMGIKSLIFSKDSNECTIITNAGDTIVIQNGKVVQKEE